MRTEIDILENEILEQYPEVLDILLRDHTTHENIFWATSNYEYLGLAYDYKVFLKLANTVLQKHINLFHFKTSPKILTLIGVNQ